MVERLYKILNLIAVKFCFLYKGFLKCPSEAFRKENCCNKFVGLIRIELTTVVLFLPPNRDEVALIYGSR